MLYSYHERMLNDENMYIYFSYVNKFGRTNLKNSSKNTCTVYLYSTYVLTTETPKIILLTTARPR